MSDLAEHLDGIFTGGHDLNNAFGQAAASAELESVVEWIVAETSDWGGRLTAEQYGYLIDGLADAFRIERECIDALDRRRDQ